MVMQVNDACLFCVCVCSEKELGQRLCASAHVLLDHHTTLLVCYGLRNSDTLLRKSKWPRHPGE
jgi:hypothetical protein